MSLTLMAYSNYTVHYRYMLHNRTYCTCVHSFRVYQELQYSYSTTDCSPTSVISVYRLVPVMEKQREYDADALRDRMRNRNRRKRNRDTESGTSRPGRSRRSGENSGPEAKSESADLLQEATVRMDETLTQGSTQPATISVSQTFNPLAVPTTRMASRGFPDFNRAMHPHVSAVNPFYAHQAMMYGQGAPCPVADLGYLKTDDLARAFLAAQGLANYGNTLAGGLQINDPSTAILRGGSVPQLAGSYATMDRSLLSPLSSPPVLQRQFFSGSVPTQSQAGLAIARPAAEQVWPRLMPSSSLPVSTAHGVIGGAQQNPPDLPPLADPMEKTEDLYMSCDEDVLSDHQIILRKQIEFFVARQIDIDNFTPGRRREIAVGQVGIRCKHCAVLPPSGRPRGTVYFPSTLRAIYQAAQNMASVHLTDTCENIEPSLKRELIELQDRKAAMGHGGKNYWAEGAAARGIYETELGLRFHEGQDVT